MRLGSGTRFVRRCRLAAVALCLVLFWLPVTAATWTQSGALHTVRSSASVVMLPTGRVLVAGGSNAAGTTAGAELFDPANGTFSVTGSMTVARQNATATVLRDGSVLIAGGSNASGALASAEIYNVSNGTFSATGTLATARSAATATLLINGRVLIVAGSSGASSIGSAELYDPGTGQFSSTGALQTTRLAATATLLPDGRVLVAGGHIQGFFNVSTASTEIYDPASGTFSPGAPLAVAREQATATLLANGKVLLAAGISQTVVQGQTLANAELFDPVGGTSTTTGPLAQARSGATAALLPHGDVLIAGGNSPTGILSSAEIYSAAAGTFSSAGSMLNARLSAGSVLLPNARVVLIGGASNSGYPTNAEVYDSTTSTFTLTGSTSPLCNGPIATPLPNGKILVVGCDNVSTAAGAGQIYDSATGLFSDTAAPFFSRNGGTATLLGGGQVLVAGGLNGNTTAEQYDAARGLFGFVGTPIQNRYYGTATLLADATVLLAGGIDLYIDSTPLQNGEIYDPATHQFQHLLAQMQMPRWHATATLLANGKVLIAGGATDFNPGTPTAKVDLYDPATRAFVITGPLASARAYATATLLPNGKVLIAGGYTLPASSGTTATAELYDPASGHFSATGSMSSERRNATAILLPNGKVLITGGLNAGIQTLANADLYDPTTGLFSPASNMTSPRFASAAALLSDGQALFTGGYFNESTFDVLKTAETYDTGLGIADARRPRIDAIAISAPAQPLMLTVSGVGFRASTQQSAGATLGSEAGSGNTLGSATNFPILLLQRVDNEQQFFVRSDPTQGWTDTEFSTVSLSAMPQGFYRATVFVNGIPSKSRLVAIAPPSKVAIVAGDSQSTQANTQFSQSLQAIVSDANDNPIQGAVVGFTCIPASNGACTTATGSQTSDAQGAVSVVVTANTKAGSYSVQAVVNGVTLATYHLSNTPGPLAHVNASSGTPQSARVNTAFAGALQVTLTDAFGNPEPATVVNFSAPGNGATAVLFGNPATTNASGVASVTALANVLAGSYAVNATSSALTTHFDLTNTVAPAARVAASNGPTFDAIAGLALAPPPAVQVTDTYGNPVAGVAVTFSAGTGNGVVTGESQITGSDGIASVGSWTLDADPGANTLQASAAGLTGSPVQFTANSSPSVDVAVTLINNRSFVQFGHTLDYVIVVTAAGPSNAHNVQVNDLLPFQLDAASAHWVCVPAIGATCAASGNGNIVNQGADISSGSSVTFVLSATVLNDPSVLDEQIINSASASAAGDTNAADDAVTLHTQAVIFRNGFEPGGDGSQ